MSIHTARIGLAAAAVIGVAVGVTNLPDANGFDFTALRKGLNQSQALALLSRQRAVDDGFAAFRDKTYREPFAGGVYIVNGDTPVLDEKELREFYDREVAKEWKSARFGVPIGDPSVALIVDAPGGTPNFWDAAMKKNLSYCISRTFGPDYTRVAAALKAATQAWEAVSDVRYVYRADLDGQCDATTPDVVFDVRPVDVGGTYLARAFFPRSPRPQRNVLIDRTGLALPPGKLTLEGILRHELGHTLSFRHEHTRPEAGKCYEDKDWKPLTSYDGFSVMHYPQCKGLGDWSLTLTDKDKTGAACLYGAAPGFTLAPDACTKI